MQIVRSFWQLYSVQQQVACTTTALRSSQLPGSVSSYPASVVLTLQVPPHHDALAAALGLDLLAAGELPAVHMQALTKPRRPCWTAACHAQSAGSAERTRQEQD